MRVQTVTPRMAEGLQFKEPGGAIIANVAENSPAAEAGLKVGDIVIGIEGKKVSDYRTIDQIVSRSRGETIPVRVWSGGKTRVVQVSVTEFPDSPWTTLVLPPLHTRTGIVSPRDLENNLIDGLPSMPITMSPSLDRLPPAGSFRDIRYDSATRAQIADLPPSLASPSVRALQSIRGQSVNVGQYELTVSSMELQTPSQLSPHPVTKSDCRCRSSDP